MSKIQDLILKYGAANKTATNIYNLDPTDNKKYLTWLFKVKYTKEGKSKYVAKEDYPLSINSVIGETLVWMEKNVSNLDVIYRDINYFTSVTHFLTTIQPLMMPSRSEVKNDIIKIMENDDWLLLIPKTIEASRAYGYGTKWCTTQDTYFKSHTGSGYILFYLIYKPLDRKFGISTNFDDFESEILNEDLCFYNNEDSELEYHEIVSVLGNSIDEPLTSLTDYFNNQREKFSQKWVLQDVIPHIIDSIEIINSNKYTKDVFGEKFDNLLEELKML
jgi:hypothetical protein